MKRLIVAISIVCMVFCLVGFAAAEDKLINYNANYCRATYPEDKDSFRTDGMYVKNVGNYAAWLTCPVLVDEVTSLQGANISISWTAAGTWDEITCSFFIGESWQSSAPKTVHYASKHGSGTVYITATKDYSTLSAYCLHCNIPKGGQLNSIRVQER